MAEQSIVKRLFARQDEYRTRTDRWPTEAWLGVCEWHALVAETRDGDRAARFDARTGKLYVFGMHVRCNGMPNWLSVGHLADLGVDRFANDREAEVTQVAEPVVEGLRRGIRLSGSLCG